jgi:hypothetical protein
MPGTPEIRTTRSRALLASIYDFVAVLSFGSSSCACGVGRRRLVRRSSAAPSCALQRERVQRNVTAAALRPNSMCFRRETGRYWAFATCGTGYDRGRLAAKSKRTTLCEFVTFVRLRRHNGIQCRNIANGDHPGSPLFGMAHWGGQRAGRRRFPLPDYQ